MRGILIDSTKREGEVYEEILFKNKKIILSKLTLMPGARIKMHTHITENEIYIIPSYVTEAVQPCYIGQSHELVNDSSLQLVVYSVKWGFKMIQ